MFTFFKSVLILGLFLHNDWSLSSIGHAFWNLCLRIGQHFTGQTFWNLLMGYGKSLFTGVDANLFLSAFKVVTTLSPEPTGLNM